LLSIGRGVEDEAGVTEFESIAAKVRATLSVSRPLVDAGLASPSRQVGQSGKTVKPKVYVALGISGAVQHLSGMRKADTIIAVNTDPEAPIFQIAHYGAVADLFDVARALPQHFE
jgi:electron transfer flavoprotein alpha subunit